MLCISVALFYLQYNKLKELSTSYQLDEIFPGISYDRITYLSFIAIVLFPQFDLLLTHLQTRLQIYILGSQHFQGLICY